MNEIKVKSSSGTYEVTIGRGLDYGRMTLEKRAAHAAFEEGCKVVVVSDDTVFSLYGEKTLESYQKAGFSVSSYVFSHGETSKTIATVTGIAEFLAKKRITRTDLLVALGGGVVGDITGFAAAIYLRGIDVIQLPTTVLAAVDSSVGGKTGVDLVAGKNLIGAFHQPEAVFCDINAFDSLPQEIVHDGMAEVIKYAMIRDRELFEQLENMENYQDMATICAKCVTIKAEIVGQDEFDTGVRRLLNFGHTMGHGVEKLSSYQISHGSAVAIGMMMVTEASVRAGLTDADTLPKLRALLEKYGLPVASPYFAEQLIDIAMSDKKRTGQTLHMVTVSRIGEGRITDINVDGMKEFFCE